MTVHIEGVRLAIFVIACVVGYSLYRHSRTQLTPGNVGEAIMVAAAVVSALVLVFTGAEQGANDRGAPTEQHSSTSPPTAPPAAPTGTPAP
ncbi:hypothetical protein HEP87_56335 [Streptomyces sp. S1D4-11]|nr:hypothetical protein [Streptomyces sp. S1D4-11]QIZ01292.1 hypothetical protein HEP87_56335 [Streptomyces sp. S1D4-11]